MRRFVLIPAALVTLGYGGGAAYLKANERALVYKPFDRVVAPPDPKWALAPRDVRYRSGDGTVLSAWIIQAPHADANTRWMLICHGQFGNIGYGDRPAFYASMRSLGINLLAFDYRGFGASEGSPREAGLYDDALASYHYLTDSLRVPPSRIVIFGHSLGSGVAIDLATRVPAAALIVEGAYTSIPDRGQELYPYFPVRLIAAEQFASLSKIGKVAMPKLFLHSPTDVVIPYEHGQRLFEAAREPKRFVTVSGGHITAFRDDSSTYFGAVREELLSSGAYPPTALLSNRNSREGSTLAVTAR